MIRSVGVDVGEIRYPILVNMPLIEIDRVGGQLTGFKFAAPDEEPWAETPIRTKFPWPPTVPANW